MARTGTVQMEPSRVELSMAVEEVLFEQRELLAERGCPSRCRGGPARRLVQSLPGEAGAYQSGAERRAPRLRPAGAADHDRALSVARSGRCGFEWIGIHDNGPGIPIESREEIFEPGRRLAGAHPDGTGMGLSIVRKIVQHYGGQVFVAPESGAGTTFVLSLPSATKSG